MTDGHRFQGAFTKRGRDILEEAVNGTPLIDLEQTGLVAEFMLGPSELVPMQRVGTAPHPEYWTWSSTATLLTDSEILRSVPANCPNGLLRLRGFVPNSDGGIWDLQMVGRRFELTKLAYGPDTGIVAIAPAKAAAENEIEAWCQKAICGDTAETDEPNGTASVTCSEASQGC